MNRIVPIGRLTTRQPFSSLFPIDQAVLDAITEDMDAHGFDPSKPIDVWGKTSVVIDGHTRLRAASSLGLREVPIYDHPFPDELAALTYALHIQRDRRNLGQAGIIAAIQAVDKLHKRGGKRGNQHTGGKPANAPGGVIASAAETAAIVGVSQRMVERSRTVLADPEARAEVEGGATINSAYVRLQRRQKDERRRQEESPGVFPTAASVPISVATPILVTPVEEALRLAKVPGAFTVAEWRALDAKTRQLLMEEAPLLGAASFNRTNEHVDWSHWTWNPVTGCLHDCDYCYARDIAARFYPQGFVPAFIPTRLHAPRHTTIPARVSEDYREANTFVCSMADLFGKWVPQEWIDAVFAEAVAAPDWRFLFLTKFPRKLTDQEWPENAWVGTSVDRQFRVEIAEKAFRDVRAGVKWLSCEPLLERLTFGSLEMFDWIVIGGESPNSHNLQGSQPEWEWVEHLLVQARAAGCRVYFKQNLLRWPKELPRVVVP